MVLSEYMEDGVLKSVYRTSNLWVRESFSAMSTALQRKDFVDPLAALTIDRGNLCEAKDYDRHMHNRSQSQKCPTRKRVPAWPSPGNLQITISRLHETPKHRSVGGRGPTTVHTNMQTNTNANR